MSLPNTCQPCALFQDLHCGICRYRRSILCMICIIILQHAGIPLPHCIASRECSKAIPQIFVIGSNFCFVQPNKSEEITITITIKIAVPLCGARYFTSAASSAIDYWTWTVIFLAFNLVHHRVRVLDHKTSWWHFSWFAHHVLNSKFSMFVPSKHAAIFAPGEMHAGLVLASKRVESKLCF